MDQDAGEQVPFDIQLRGVMLPDRTGEFLTIAAELVSGLGQLSTAESFATSVRIGDIPTRLPKKRYEGVVLAPRVGQIRTIEGLEVKRIQMSEEERAESLPELSILVREALQVKGISIKAAARRAGIDGPNFQKLVSGKQLKIKGRVVVPGPQALIKIARELDIEPSELLSLMGFEIVEAQPEIT